MEGRRVSRKPRRNPLYTLFMSLLALTVVLLITVFVLNVKLRSARRDLADAQTKIEQLRKAGNAYMDDSLRQTEEVVSKALAEIRETRMKFRTVTEAQQQRKTPNVDVEV